MRLTQIIEALLFASDAPLSAADLLRIDEQLDEDTVEAVIQELRGEYEQSERSFQIYEVGGGYQLLTRPEFVTVLERYDSVPQPARLSVPALEVLAIIAYRQPIGRAEIEDIRGVGSSGVLRTLQERNLVDAVARGEGLGRPLLYGTTQKFLEHFGFRSLEDLPRPDELPVVLRERTAPSPPPTAPDAEPAAVEAPQAAPVESAAIDETRSIGDEPTSDETTIVADEATTDETDIVVRDATSHEPDIVVDDVASKETHMVADDAASDEPDIVADDAMSEETSTVAEEAGDGEHVFSEVGERAPGE